MHDHSTRAQHHHRRSFGRTASAAAAVFLSAFAATALVPEPAYPAQPSDIEISRAPEASDLGAEVTRPSHDLAIEIVAPGREGLELSARLTEDGGLIEFPMTWTVSTLGGEIIFSDTSPGADVSAPPGDYVVDIRYGSARLVSTVTLLEANRLMVSYVLNAGGLRVLPRVRDIGATVTPAISRVFARDGVDSGKLVAESLIPGEIIRLPEGDYRVESRFAAGNASAVTDVHVKAGRLSAIDIDHKAGLARLAFTGSPGTEVEWNIRDNMGLAVVSTQGQQANVVLRPGTYTASAKVGSAILTATFDIATGEARDIILGN